jgi:PAT family beta-lactamase induction signal transducer AmpG
LINPEPASPAFAPETQIADGSFAHWTGRAFVAPFTEFIANRRGWLAILLLILLYKYGDAMLSVMKIPFFLEMNFSKTEIAVVTKFFGIGAIIFGGFLGGVLLAKIGIMRGLLISAILMGASNLIFIAQAVAGDNLTMLAVTIAVENVTTGMGTVAFVAYLSSLCNAAYTATQFALLTSFMALSRTVMSSGAGWLADQVDWISFFALTTVAAVPGILLLAWMMRRYGEATERNGG